MFVFGCESVCVSPCIVAPHPELGERVRCLQVASPLELERQWWGGLCCSPPVLSHTEF